MESVEVKKGMKFYSNIKQEITFNINNINVHAQVD